jgi:hypothetical protein
MLRSTLALLAVAAIASNSYAADYRIEKVFAEGLAFTRNEAIVSAQNEVNSLCQRQGGTTRLATINVESCLYLGPGYQCQATCDCMFPN